MLITDVPERIWFDVESFSHLDNKVITVDLILKSFDHKTGTFLYKVHRDLEGSRNSYPSSRQKQTGCLYDFGDIHERGYIIAWMYTGIYISLSPPSISVLLP